MFFRLVTISSFLLSRRLLRRGDGLCGRCWLLASLCWARFDRLGLNLARCWRSRRWRSNSGRRPGRLGRRRAGSRRRGLLLEFGDGALPMLVRLAIGTAFPFPNLVGAFLNLARIVMRHSLFPHRAFPRFQFSQKKRGCQPRLGSLGGAPASVQAAITETCRRATSLR